MLRSDGLADPVHLSKHATSLYENDLVFVFKKDSLMKEHAEN